MRLLLLAAALLLAPASHAQRVATYRVTFESTWTPAGYPAGYPANAHFSPFVGVPHSADVSFWAPGRLASPGIRAMAERGETAPLVREFDVPSETGAWAIGPATFAMPWSVDLDLALTDETPLVTIVSMLAPSPDWFVGVHDLDIRVGGAFPDRAVASFPAYDAGTDSGPAYASPNAPTQPREPVGLLGAAPFVAGQPVGTFTFVRTNATAGEGGAEALAFGLSNPAPNPARGASTLALSLGEAQTVDVRVLDALGRTVAVLAQGAQPAGALSLRLDTAGLAAGVYTVVARGAAATAARRLVVAR